MNDDMIWLTPNYGVGNGSTWDENDTHVLIYNRHGKFSIGEPKERPIAEIIKKKLPRKA